MRAPIIATALLAFAASTTHADDKAKAKALYEEGLRRYNVAEYAEAIKAWKEAYLLSKRPLLLFNIAQAYRLSGDCKQALIFYDNYQREEPSPKNQDEFDEALKLCKEAKPTAPDPVTPVDRPVGSPPPDATPPGQPVDAGTSSVSVAQVETPAPAEPSDASPTTGGGLRKIGIGVGIAGVVIGGVGLYFASDSARVSNKLEQHRGEWGPNEVDLEARGERSAKLGWVLGVTGIAAIAAGGVMFAIGGPKAVETTSVSIVPTRGGVAAGLSLRF